MDLQDTLAINQANTCPSEILKSATASNHEQLESMPCMQQLMSNYISTDTYAQILLGFLSFHRAWEEHLHHACSDLHLPLIVLGTRSQHIMEDLSALPKAVTRHPQAFSFSKDFNTKNAKLGALYVVEGSALGGSFIAHHLSKRSEILPHRFFKGENDRISLRWREVVIYVNSSLNSSEDIEQACEGANMTFIKLRELFSTII